MVKKITGHRKKKSIDFLSIFDIQDSEKKKWTYSFLNYINLLRLTIFSKP